MSLLRRSMRTAFLGLLLAFFGTAHVSASSGLASASDSTTVSTTVTVRVVSNDAKLVQDPVGGARVVIRHAETGEVLAEGRQTGNSGSTDKIMNQPHERGATIYEAPGAAKFQTTIPLAGPTPVIVTAEGPLDYPESMQTASASATLVPGEDITGDGLVLTLHGFIVEMLSPEAGARVDGGTVAVRARVRLLCGCPTQPDGLWDSSRYDMKAQIVSADGEVLTEAPMRFTGTTNEYEADVPMPSENAATLRVVVADAERVNFGVAEREM
ncbi:hypothetical protein [Longibacter sp.]|uniref:hypothetical protein n=1 Tax=Longibacter sp. TaxID=2045415 RepID=UPI003EB7BC78